MDGAGPRVRVALPPEVEAVRGQVEGVLAEVLAAWRRELEALDPEAGALVGELERLLEAGGKRLRPVFCYLGFRAAGGSDGEPIARVGAALELLHTFALVHDDVMDGAVERRDVETTEIRFARSSPPGSTSFGRSVAVLVGDLAAVLAEMLFRTCDFPAERLSVALARFDRMRLEMAVGQYLDLRRPHARDLESAVHVAELKTGSYTVEGPLLVGSALAGASEELETRLLAYGRPTGEAFQLRDDVVDHEAPPGAADRVRALVDEAVSALDGADLEPTAHRSLRRLAEMLRLPEA